MQTWHGMNSTRHSCSQNRLFSIFHPIRLHQYIRSLRPKSALFIFVIFARHYGGVVGFLCRLHRMLSVYLAEIYIFIFGWNCFDKNQNEERKKNERRRMIWKAKQLFWYISTSLSLLSIKKFAIGAKINGRLWSWRRS